MAEPYISPPGDLDRADSGTELVFWLRLAKAGILILVGAAAHQWLLPAQMPIDPIDVPRTVAERHDSAPAVVPDRAAFVRVGTAGPPLQPGAASSAFAAPPVPARPSRPAIVRRLPPRGKEARVLRRQPPADELPVGTTGVTSSAFSAPSGPARPSKPAVAAPPSVDPVTIATLGYTPLARAVDPPPIDLPVAPVVAIEERRDREPAMRNAAAEPAQPSTEEAAEQDATARVRQVLQEYRAAYESLDVAAARTIWPSVDHVALTHAFRQLARQRVTFQSCGISVSGASALARCRGRAEYIPKVGPQRALLATGEWVFDLAKSEADWKIVSASVR